MGWEARAEGEREGRVALKKRQWKNHIETRSGGGIVPTNISSRGVKKQHQVLIDICAEMDLKMEKWGEKKRRDKARTH